ncbi:hypothetical protein JDS99_26960, partial [Bacillus cereus group sp. N6]|nr:hypothetical protein [Bacillus cereus group sp. N6]
MRGVSMDNKNQKQFVGGTVGKGKKYTWYYVKKIDKSNRDILFVKQLEIVAF